MGNGNTKRGPPAEDVSGTDFEAVRADILRIVDSPDWDDGSYGPLLIRLAWHSSGTYCAADGTGGSNGATMRYPKEGNDPDNAGLQDARQLLEPIKAKYPNLSRSDLWVLAAYVAIQHTGGPVIPFTGGRVDKTERFAIEPGRLPNPEAGVPPGMEVDGEGRIKGWEQAAAHIRAVFGRMGFSDREMVALICGGHVYGRCHTGSSGYAGAWVENPTRFSNEYAADMFGDEWMLVTHDTKLPNGEEIPEEVRPLPGKRQYIDLTKALGEAAAEQARAAPDSSEYPAGKYVCVSDWVNCRETQDTGSPILGRLVKDQIVNIVMVKVFGTAIRGQAERGGWVSIVGSGGKALFERQGDLDTAALKGLYRPLMPVPYFQKAESTGPGLGKLPGENFQVSEVKLGTDEDTRWAIFGRTPQGWALLYSPKRGLMAELIVAGYNETPRHPIKGQSGQQMMLITDMVMLWDPGFRAVLQEYADDQEVLSRDFGAAFKRLTELGCPWSRDSKYAPAASAGCGLFG